MPLVKLPEPDRGVIQRRDIIVQDLSKLLGRDRLIADEDGRRAFETDALTSYRRLPLLVILPQSTADVSKALKYCHENGLKVVPRGAGTSLCGGSLPAEDSVVICVSKLNRILDIDIRNRTVSVEAGITNLAISAAVSPDGYFYAPDPSSQLACTLAGNLAMNSGGAHCLKYGVTTNNVLGVKMVMMDGTVADIGGQHADASGYDLLSLIIGSEGQLGIVTEATVRILRAAEGARPMMLGFDTAAAAGACVAAIIAAGIVPVAIEFMDKPAIHTSEAFAKAGYPMDVEALLIIEVEGSAAEIGRLLARIADIARPFGPKTSEIARDEDHSRRIWQGRKAAFSALGRISDYMCMDGTIPLSRLSEVLTRIAEICAERHLKVANIFHAGDGNLHPLIMYDANNPEEAEAVELAGAEILKLCVAAGGCLTGEHGVGIEKRDLMRVQFSDVDLAVQMRIKTVFDPGWLLNSAKVFPLDGRDVAAAAA